MSEHLQNEYLKLYPCSMLDLFFSKSFIFIFINHPLNTNTDNTSYLKLKKQKNKADKALKIIKGRGENSARNI